jgi:dipeptidyl aminopeptidase/acylaminoacyl peptidase
MLASGWSVPTRVVTVDSKGVWKVVKRSHPENLPSESFAKPENICWEGKDGCKAHGIIYPPQNQSFEGIGKPPLMVLVHGGPTSQRSVSFDGQAQYFTSRGWFVLQVNYRGSTGYGREYRDMLKGNWGIFDVLDSISGAEHLVKTEKVDGARLVIMGGSAGGFTVLKALEDFPGFFKAGICLYGVANQFALVSETHKFEERYSDSLLGALPQASAVYRDRSPVFFADRIQDPIAIFQGEDDKVVPKSQAEEIVEALKRNGVQFEYHLYPGEGHGFRKIETIENYYKAIDKFLLQHVIYS